MRLALFSDIHGNCIALDAVLADIDRRGGVDEIWVLGDLIAVGTQPLQVLERLNALPSVRYTRGNTDGYIATGLRPPPSAGDVALNFDKLRVYEEVALTMAWTQGATEAAGWMPFLDALPLEQRLTLPDGTRLLGVHASPGEDNSPGIRPDYAFDEIETRFANSDADLICVGHTHWPMAMQVGESYVLNLGTVGNPRVPGLEAWYVMIEADEDGYEASHYAVEYDLEAYMRTVDEVRHPAGGFICKFVRGERIYPFDEVHLPPVVRG